MLELLQKRLETYQVKNLLEEENALKEILQELALFALWRADFFDIAAFQGGTSLRIVHGLPRFSEDLDFILKEEAEGFNWQYYLKELENCFSEFGLKSEFSEKGKMTKVIRTAVIKDNSFAREVNLSFYRGQPEKKISIKLEIDTNPPAGSSFAYSYLDFPLDFEICHQDLASNFSLKLHALFCRRFLKGRDWYDFIWYLKQGVSPNLPHFQKAIEQMGPWSGQKFLVDKEWLKKTLKEKIETIDWQLAAKDVERFLKPIEQKSLELWSEEFFLHKVAQLQ